MKSTRNLPSRIPSAAPIALGTAYKGPFIYPQKLKVLPQFTRPDMAFNSYNQELRKKKFRNVPLSKSIYNMRFVGNGSRGRQQNEKSDVLKVASMVNLRKQTKEEKNINLDEEAVQEQKQLNFDGAELRGKRETDKADAKAWIKKYGGVIKYNRGAGETSGHYSGGLLRREYEASQLKIPTKDTVEYKDDEFKNLTDMTEEHEDKANNNKIKEQIG